MIHTQRIITIKYIPTALTLVLFLFPSSTLADNPDYGFDLYWDNDGAFFKPNDRHDRHYTNGIKAVVTGQNMISVSSIYCPCTYSRSNGVRPSVRMRW